MKKTLLVAALAACAVSCMTPDFTPVTQYVLTPAPSVQKASDTGMTVGVRPFDAERPYKLDIVYRESDYVLEKYPNASWSELPKDVVTRAVRDALVDAGAFRDVGHAVDVAVPDLVLTGAVRRFEEARTCAPREAQCEVRLELREALPHEFVWAKTLKAAVPLEEESIAALAAAMTRAIEQVAEQAAAEINAAVAAQQRPDS